MKNIKMIISLVFALFFFVLLATNTVTRAETTKRVIIVFNDEVNTSSFNEKYQLSDTRELKAIKGQSATVSERNFKALSKDPSVKYVANDDIVTLVKTNTETILADTLPWGVDQVNSEQVWSSYTGIGIKIAVLDTGIDMDHPDLVANIKGGYNAITTNKTFDDDNGHGTHVAGTIAASRNELGVIGVAPDAHIYGVKVLNRRGSGYTSDIIEGIDWAINNGMDIISMSLGSAAYNKAFEDAINKAHSSGIILVAATGNESTSVSYPAAFANVIAVGAVDNTNTIATFSNFGPQVDVVAPGVQILSTYTGGRYAYMDGTSMATPHVTGVIALMLQSGSASTLTEIRARFATNCIDLGAVGKDNYYGYGLVDASLLTN